MNPVIVVMGAEGVLGRYACRHFSRLGWEVVAVGHRREGVACDDGDGMYLPAPGIAVGGGVASSTGSGSGMQQQAPAAVFAFGFAAQQALVAAAGSARSAALRATSPP